MKLSAAVDLASDFEVPPFEQDDADEACNVYRLMMGNVPRPKEDATLELPAGLKALFATRPPPHVDVAVRGLFGQRTHKNLELSSMTMGAKGALQQTRSSG